jgi:type IV pilus assembly protein PilM
MNACAPGYQVFSKFVKLPPVDTSKVTQIIQYEAQQNVPFPLDEVVWDYQITGNTPTGELEVFLVAIKADIVEGLFRMADASGLRLQLVDVSPAALCNAFRFNYPDQEGCIMLLDIGAKTSNVLFFEKGKYSSRGINIGANSITQDFATEARMPFTKAEKFKIAEGFVSLGGAYEEPENPQQAQISKIARQVLTRLHIQVNQTIQFYRGQQGGAAPQKLLLAGGASILPYTAQFFSEKLNLPVEYFNPLRNVQIDPSVNLEELAKVAHTYGEVVGLGLRNLAQCPIELNLMPKTIRQRQQFNQKKPYFIATVVSLVLSLLIMGWFYNVKIVAAKQEVIKQVDTRVTPLKAVWEKVDKESQQIANEKRELDQIGAWTEDRTYWLNVLGALRASLLASEARVEGQPDLMVKGAKAGLWIDKMSPDIPGSDVVPTAGESDGQPRYRMSPEMMKRYFPLMNPAMMAQMGGGGDTNAAAKPTNEINTINLHCTAMNLNRYSDTANADLMNAFRAQLQARTNLFSDGTDLGKTYTPPETNDVTFSFDAVLKLKRPIKI